MSRPKLSICCITYNHVRYLKQALDSVLNQVVDFDFEIIIGDDCSTDGSQVLLKKYAAEYPAQIQLILQPFNTGGSKNFNDVYKLASGEYVIVLETDDFWTDVNKLKVQVDFLDQHPECIAVAHNCKIVDENSKELNESYPNIKSGWYTYKDFMYGLMPGQTTTLMYRNFMLDTNFDKTLWENQVSGPGDLKKVFSFLAYGKIYTLPFCMSAYRHVLSGGTSFSANHKRDELTTVKYYCEFQKYARKFDDKDMILSADVRLFQTVLSAYVRRVIDIHVLLSYFKTCKYPLATFLYSLLSIYKIKSSR